MVTVAIIAGVTLVIGSVIYFVRKSVLNIARADGLEATTKLQDQRIRVQEDAETTARVKARKETDVKADSVRTADDAAKLLQDAFSDDPYN